MAVALAPIDGAAEGERHKRAELARLDANSELPDPAPDGRGRQLSLFDD